MQALPGAVALTRVQRPWPMSEHERETSAQQPPTPSQRAGKPSVSYPQRGCVAEIQRQRILSATVHLACERGAQAFVVSDVIELAGVSRRTFYDLFADREDCLREAFERALAHAHQRARVAYDGEQAWVDRIRAALLALLEFFDEQPELAQLCVVQGLSGDRGVLTRRAQVLEQLAGVIDQGRERAVHEPPPLTAEGAVYAGLGLLYVRLLAPRPPALRELLRPIMSSIVLPYLGVEAARRELLRDAPPRRSHGAQRTAAFQSLQSLKIRLTYRTLRVLAAIAAEPGLSNLAVSERAGISDQGQIAKLLARLSQSGLIENVGKGPGKGAPNVWQLSQVGRELERAIRRSSSARA
jgi:AcrR family transcriptional regulator/DNA-binding MarR family transcriptional regulator